MSRSTFRFRHLAPAALVVAAFVCSARAELASTADSVKPLAVGAEVPEATLMTSSGDSFSLRDEATKQPTVIIFYRGGWCPYCTEHLAEIQGVEKQLVDLGFRILAISPDLSGALEATKVKTKAAYTLLADPEGDAAEAFGLRFRIDDETVERYKNYGITLPLDASGAPWLPVPALYLLGKNGRIGFAHWDAKYQKRLTADAVLGAAREVEK